MFKSAIICVYLCLMLFNQSPEFDLLIRGGRVVDGSGRAAYTADVAIKGDRIVRIGDLSKETATRVIDARDTASLSRNNPYAGLTLPGEVVATFLRGRPTVRDRALVEGVTV